MDWEGIATAYLDRERARLGLPSREEEAALRTKREQEAAAAASELESQSVGRDLTRARLAALPEEQRLQREALQALTAQRNAAAEREPVSRTTEFGDFLSKSPEDQAKILALRKQWMAADDQAPRPDRPPYSGWSPQYGPDGKLAGYYHPAVGFTPVGTPGPGGGAPLPPGTRPTALTGSERDALALGSVSIRAGDNMRKALEATRAAEAESPLDPGTWTGPIAGRFGQAYRGAVSTAGPAGDFDQARAEGRSLVYALSGKQINETEQKWLDGILPRLSDQGVEQQIERFDRFVGFMRQAKAAGYSDPFSVAQAQFDAELPSAAAAEAPVVPQSSPTGAPKARKRYNPQTGRVE